MAGWAGGRSRTAILDVSAARHALRHDGKRPATNRVTRPRPVAEPHGRRRPAIWPLAGTRKWPTCADRIGVRWTALDAGGCDRGVLHTRLMEMNTLVRSHRWTQPRSARPGGSAGPAPADDGDSGDLHGPPRPRWNPQAAVYWRRRLVALTIGWRYWRLSRGLPAPLAAGGRRGGRCRPRRTVTGCGPRACAGRVPTGKAGPAKASEGGGAGPGLGCGGGGKLSGVWGLVGWRGGVARVGLLGCCG